MQNKNTSGLLKTTFLVFLIFSSISYAQPKKIEKIHEFVKNISLDINQLPNIPEKWKNESAVVIIDHYNHYYNKTKKSLDNFYLTRRVVQLNDKAAVEKFSEFNYPTVVLENGKTIKTWMGIKIIKPNGDIKTIDVEKEKIKTSKDKKAYVYGFIGVRMASDQIYKLAIPDLEIGDKIDYFIYTYEEYSTLGIDVMTPIETTLRGEYPIVDFKFKLKVENDFFINFKSFNGAPKLEDITPDKQRDKEYQLIAQNIDKLKSSRWLHSLVEYPCYKYQISFAQKGVHENRAFAFLSEKEDIVKENVSPDEIKTKFKYSYVPEGDYKNLKKKFKDRNFSQKEYLKEVYYFMRHSYCNDRLERLIYFKQSWFDKHPVNFYASYSVSGFIKAYCEFLKKQKIPYEIILAKRRYDGTIDDLLIRGNLVTFIKVNLENEEPIYIYPFRKNTFYNWIPALFENAEAYALSFDKYDWVENVQKITLPYSTHEKNTSLEETSVNFEDDFSSIKINRVSTLKGHNKTNEINDQLFFFDYILEEHKRFETEPYIEKLSKRERKEYEKYESEYIVKKREERLERLKKSVENEFEITIEDYDNKTLENGRLNLEDPLKYEENFVIKDDLMKRAGPNYIFEIGKLIGGQVAIDEDEKNRKENIYMNYPRSFKNKITLTVPEGYEVAGIDKLNFNIENETGGFVSKANLNGNVLEVESYKYYTHNYEPNENWDKMLEYLEAAFQFSQEKILLKKV